MGILRSPIPVCPVDKHCLRWVRVYLKDCVCSVRDQISFSLGMISVISWAVAEVPQIITNYKEKSTEGMSLMFLMTWVVGDLLNLFGCWLEPATLPTQFYMALLYTVTTMVLLFQTLYYDYLYKTVGAKITSFCLWFQRKGKSFHLKEQPKEDPSKDCKIKPPNVTQNLNGSSNFSARNGSKSNVPEELPGLTEVSTSTSPIPVASLQSARRRAAGRDLYYMSARSLAKSRTPTAGSHIAVHGSWPRTNLGLITDHGSVDDKDLLSSLVSPTSSAPTNSKSLFCAVGGIVFLGALNLRLSVFKTTPILSNELRGIVLSSGRKLLQDVNDFNQISIEQGGVSRRIGSYMGWLMAIIYMGGRLPQIFLNIKRGTAEGLSLFMFMFAIIGNATYVGSILVRNTEWAKIKPNMPWLVDASVCVLLDCFIIAQFIYFQFRKANDEEDTNGAYEAAD